MSAVLAFVLVGLAAALTRAPEYRAAATLMLATSQGGDLTQLRGLATQIGVNVGGSRSSALTPDLVAQMATSPAVLQKLAGDSLAIPELGPGKRAISDLLKFAMPAGQDRLSPEERRRATITALGKRMTASADRRTGAITLSMAAPWPSLALQLVQRITASLDAYLFSLSQGRASAERRSIEERLTVQERRLRGEEERLARFLQQNRLYLSSPGLRFEYERLQRAVALQQQVLVSLAQSREDALNREIQAAPTLTVLQPPLLPMEPEPRKRLRTLLLAAAGGLFAGVILVLVGNAIRNAMVSGSPEAQAFRAQLRALVPRRTSSDSTNTTS